jgi:putative flippase GtrA
LLQLIIDSTDINTLNALYISISIGISLKFFWAWNVRFTFIDSLSDQAQTKIIHPFFTARQNRINHNLILIRIVKYIRRKKYTQDDAEIPISCCYI